MGKKMFLLSFAAIFSLLLSIQGYFLLDEDAIAGLRAERIGADIVHMAENAIEAEKRISALSLYLTMETEGNQPADTKLLVNGKYVGNFSKGILTVNVCDGDTLSLLGGEGTKISIPDYPAVLDESRLAATILAEEKPVLWGKIFFK